MYAGAPLSLGAFRGQVPEADRPYRSPPPASWLRSRSSSPTCSSTGRGFEVVWKLGIVLVIGYVVLGVSMAFDRNRPKIDFKSATWLPAC